VYYRYTSPQLLDFLEFAKNCSFLNWKLHSAQVKIYGWAQRKEESQNVRIRTVFLSEGSTKEGQSEVSPDKRDPIHGISFL
jgi:hypothetical protein